MAQVDADDTPLPTPAKRRKTRRSAHDIGVHFDAWVVVDAEIARLDSLTNLNPEEEDRLYRALDDLCTQYSEFARLVMQAPATDARSIAMKMKVANAAMDIEHNDAPWADGRCRWMLAIIMRDIAAMFAESARA